MSELSQQIRETLDELHAELAAVEKVDPDMRARLLDVASEIQQKLSGSEQPSAKAADDKAIEEQEPESLQDRLSEASLHFESSHPTLTNLIANLNNALNQLGI